MFININHIIINYFLIIIALLFTKFNESFWSYLELAFEKPISGRILLGLRQFIFLLGKCLFLS